MTCVERASRNSLLAYSHLFEPRPERRNTLKKRRESADVQIVGVPAHELVASELRAAGLPAYSTEASEQRRSSDLALSLVPGPPQAKATATATDTDTEYALPWGWRPRRPSVGTAAWRPAPVATHGREESRIEQAKVPVRMQ